jgi:hypothetical protein
MYYSDPSRENEPHALPDVEVFYINCKEQKAIFPGDDTFTESGWYWWFCFPGCMPDGDAVGPFKTEKEAVADFRENWG